MGLAGTIQILGQQPKEQAEGGVGSLIQGHAMTLPTGCIWIEEHLERRPPSTHTHTHTHTINDPRLFGAAAWPGLVGSTAKADGTLGGCRLGVRCAWAVMWVMEAHRHALARARHAGRIYLVMERNVAFMVVHFECVDKAGHGEALRIGSV